MSVKTRVLELINRKRRYVFLREDFEHISSYDQVGRALRQLVQEGKLIKLGYGVYTKAKLNPFTGITEATCPLGDQAIMNEALKRLEVVNKDMSIDMKKRFKRDLKIGEIQVNYKGQQPSD